MRKLKDQRSLNFLKELPNNNNNNNNNIKRHPVGIRQLKPWIKAIPSHVTATAFQVLED